MLSICCILFQAGATLRLVLPTTAATTAAATAAATTPCITTDTHQAKSSMLGLGKHTLRLQPPTPPKICASFHTCGCSEAAAHSSTQMYCDGAAVAGSCILLNMHGAEPAAGCICPPHVLSALHGMLTAEEATIPAIATVRRHKEIHSKEHHVR
jgi:hypothetical protein